MARLGPITWTTEMEMNIIRIVRSEKGIYEGIKRASLELGISVDSVRNRWYSNSMRKLRNAINNGEISLEENEPKKKIVKKKVQHPQPHQPQHVIVKEEMPQEIPQDISQEITQIEQQHQPTQMQINNAITKDAKEAIKDIIETMELMTDCLTRMVQSNSTLLTENEDIKIKYNDMLREYTDMGESYTYMLKMLNQARTLALKEEDERNGISVSEVTRTFKMDKNGNLNIS